ncbi:MAG: ABC transporter permease [Gemmatimonadaceae bacterium]|nr:ABC transporter permease [Gemmatimonadaceae bacterium]MCU0634731.1 ABC transporter permease [Gemmatimonadaceae bacterium]
MRTIDILRTALGQLRSNPLRSFFTLLGIIVSVAFLVAVVAVIEGMNAYVRENVAGAIVGVNVFQVRRTPLSVGLYDDEEFRLVQRRPRIDARDAAAVRAALPDAEAIGVQSGWPTPLADVQWRNRTLGSVQVFGITAPYQTVQDYQVTDGRPLSDLDVIERRPVVVVGADVAEKLFDGVSPVGQTVRLMNARLEVVGVIGRKGRVLGQSFDGFALIPIPLFEMIYGRRNTTVISVKMGEAANVADGMARAEEAMRLSRQLRPGDPDNFSIDTADALVDFWKKTTAVLFAVIPAVVAIGVVVGGIVIMNVMLMAVQERTYEIGIRKSMGATARDIKRQFLTESVALSTAGGAIGVTAGWILAVLVATFSPLPARITGWSVVVALALGAGIGVLFGVYPAARAAKLDPITALRTE